MIFLSTTFLFKESINRSLGNHIETYGLVALFIISIILEFMPQYIAPQLFAINAAILGFSFINTLLVIYIGSMFGDIIGFGVGRKYRERTHSLFFENKTIRKIEQKINKKGGKTVLLIAAISPIPFLPIIFGSLGLKRKNFLIFGLIPRTVYTILIVSLFFYIF